MKHIVQYAVVCIALLCVSCKTYYIPVADFRPMFAGKTRSRIVTTQSPFGGRTTYSTYPIDVIKCQDKKGNAHELVNGPFIEMRVTDTNGRRTVFYFDKILVSDSMISGEKSRILGITANIHINSLKKIEVQNGGKKYSYVKVEDR